MRVSELSPGKPTLKKTQSETSFTRNPSVRSMQEWGIQRKLNYSNTEHAEASEFAKALQIEMSLDREFEEIR